MNTNNSTKGIDLKALRRYLEAREIIDERAEKIINVSHMMSLLKYCDEDTVPVSPHALAYFSDMIYSEICKITETLDNFVYILEAKKVLNELKD